ncbi:LarC family nickel insertion protein [Paraburkholderia dinghuensis]|uniref:LarC family nickel insertion protein n=1 Tax=Paraburkholderia dinghuensis TaxID=2305225 RepID=A0A3N6PL36_9BURK|nr:LarC family nickel insertion protein [Paraburkholderia dinghuensis]RQH02090.1 LarC family nickel insertion protein [Paraburkholderia dinghuensis]
MAEKDNCRRLCVHLDPLGGIAGDMFVAALLDAFPEFEDTVRDSIDQLSLGPDAECRLELHNDGTLVGHRFIVGVPGALSHRHEPAGADGHAGEIHEQNLAEFSELRGRRDQASPESRHDHAHRRWQDIRELLQNAPLSDAVKQHAVSIFQLLAQAEARVHGVAEEEVTFHEIGAVDTICDIVAASALIASVHADWSVAPLPLGQGRVRSEHGLLPVPAPATVLLLEGFETIQDGFSGERVTPTGAAIVRYLCNRQVMPSLPRALERSGIGFGTRRIAGLSNCVRVLVSREQAQSASRLPHRELTVIEFDIDDQAPEDLSIGLDRIRAQEGVHDVVQFSGIGKKGRSFAHIRILAAPVMLERAIEACFAETTTIGLRYYTVNAKALARSIDSVEVDGRRIRVKSVERPNGQWTAKAEIDDVAREGNRSERTRLRSHAENMVLSRRKTGDAQIGQDEERVRDD